MCLRVIGNYGMNFRPNPKHDRTRINFLKFLKWKMETLVFSLPLKKSKLFLIFFLLVFMEDESRMRVAGFMKTIFDFFLISFHGRRKQDASSWIYELNYTLFFLTLILLGGGRFGPPLVFYVNNS